jgi:NNP family nitrate/nitrite transporter-like MFS transporter
LCAGSAHAIIAVRLSGCALFVETQTVTARPGYRTVFGLAFAVAFLADLLLFALSPAVHVVMVEMHLSHAQFGLLFSASIVSLMLSRLPLGLVADRRGYVPVLRVALIGSALAAAARALAPDYTTLLVSQFVLGLGLAALMPCLSLMVKAGASARPGLGTGIYFSGYAVGSVVALGLTPLLLGVMPYRHVLLLYAALPLVVCLASFSLGRSGQAVASNIRLADVRLLLREPVVWVLLLLMAGAMGCYDTLTSWMPRVLQMKAVEPWFASLMPAGFFAAGPLTGYVLDRFRRRGVLVALLGLLAAAATALIAMPSQPLLLVCLFVVGFALSGVSVVSLTMPVEQPRLSPYAGTVVGFVTSASNLGPLVLPVVFGRLIDVTGYYSASLFTVAALGAVIFLACSRFMR